MIDAAKVKAALDAIASGDQAAISAALTDLLAALVAGDDSATEEPAATEGLAEGADAPPDPKEVAATTSALRKLTGCASAGEAIEFLTNLKAQVDTLSADRAALDMSSRRELVGELVKLGVEFPSTAWAPEEFDAAGKGKPRVPAKRFMAEPLEELRARVVMLRAVKKAPPKIEAPEGGSGAETLSADQKAAADRITDPKKKARFLEMCAKSPLNSKGEQ
jgi:hypothetical protein